MVTAHSQDAHATLGTVAVVVLPWHHACLLAVALMHHAHQRAVVCVMRDSQGLCVRVRRAVAMAAAVRQAVCVLGITLGWDVPPPLLLPPPLPPPPLPLPLLPL